MLILVIQPLIKTLRLACAVLAGLWGLSAQGSESCGAWRMTDADPSGGLYMMAVQLRSCELTGGVSAFLQFQNSGNERLKVFYRIHTEEKKPKEGNITLAPGETARGATCQQCTRRKGGIKSWEIVSVEVLAATPSPAAPDAAVVAPQAPEVQKNKTDLKPAVATPEVVKPAVAIPAPDTPPLPAVAAPAPIVTAAPVAKPAVVIPAPTTPSLPVVPVKTTPPPPTTATTAPEGLVTEDGTVIPWDQLPPEFRPKK